MQGFVGAHRDPARPQCPIVRERIRIDAQDLPPGRLRVPSRSLSTPTILAAAPPACASGSGTPPPTFAAAPRTPAIVPSEEPARAATAEPTLPSEAWPERVSRGGVATRRY